MEDELQNMEKTRRISKEKKKEIIKKNEAVGETYLVRAVQEKNLLYLRVDEEEAMIDWSTDTHDGGLHLNVYGAEKASRWLGNALKAALSLPDRREEESILWEERIKRYHYCREVTS